MKRLPLFLVVALAATAAAQAPAPPAPDELGPRYVDPVAGFSLQPPAQADFKKEFSPTLQGNWLVRNEPKGPVVWQLRVLRAREADQSVPLAQQVATLHKRLSGKPGVKLESIKQVTLPAGQVIDLSTVVGGATYERQVWAQNAPGRFVIFSVVGPANEKGHLDRTFDAVLATIELSDPTAAQQQRQERLERGRGFLSALSASRLEQAFRPDQQWLLIRQEDQNIGLTHIRIAPDEGGSFKVDIRTYLAPPGQAVQTLTHRMSISGDLKAEKWQQTRVTGAGPGAVVVSETGGRNGDMLRSHVTAGTTDRPLSRPLDASVRPYYLARALAMVLGRLVDLHQPAEYAFAVYDSMSNEFKLHAFIVDGPETLTVGGRSVPAIRVTEQPAEDVATSTLWLNEAGRTLAARSSEGVLLEEVDEAAARAAFPDAAAELAQD